MYLKIMKLLLFLYTLCLYIVNTLNLDLLRSIISKFDNFCVYLEKKVFVKYMGKTFNQLYYWPQRWHFWEIEGSCLMKFPSEECFKICQFFWNILCYFNFFPKEYPGVFQHRSSGQLYVGLHISEKYEKFEEGGYVISSSTILSFLQCDNLRK